MANTSTKGRITRGSASAGAGLKVEVHDQDFDPFGNPSHTKFLGSATTNNDGDYLVTYSDDDYAPWYPPPFVDEDTVTVPATVGTRLVPGNPDLFLRVFDGAVQLGESSIRQDVAEDRATIDFDLPTNAAPPADPLLTLVTNVADAVDGGAAAVGGFVDDVVAVVTDALGGLPGVGPAVTGASGAVTAANRSVLDFVNQFSDQIRRETNRDIPEDLLERFRILYRDHKRALLLRHFFPPEHIDPAVTRGELPAHHARGRYIPYLVSDYAIFGYRRPVAQLKCSTGEGGSSYYENDQLADFDDFRTARWFDFFRLRHGAGQVENHVAGRFLDHAPLYARVYENGLMFTGSFIAAIAYEAATPGVDAEERRDCEGLLALAVDALEDLELRGGLAGYLIRFHEEGVPVGQDDTGNLVSCGFTTDPTTGKLRYCLPLSRMRDDHEKDLGRQRHHEPSGDEYTHLIEGLVAACGALPSDSPVRSRIRALLARIHRYLLEHFTYLLRPCGNFVFRGAATPFYEFPWAAAFLQFLGVGAPDEPRPTTEEVWAKARVTGPLVTVTVTLPVPGLPGVATPLPISLAMPSDVLVEDIGPIVGLEAFGRAVPPQERFAAYSLVGNNNTVGENGEGTPVWTLWMLTKASHLGRWCPNEREALAAAFKSWFATGQNRNHKPSWQRRGEAWGAMALATAISLCGDRRSQIWDALRDFFSDRELYPLRHAFMVPYWGAVGELPKKLRLQEWGQHAVCQTMWPIATIARALGKQMSAPLSQMSVPGPLPGPAIEPAPTSYVELPLPFDRDLPQTREAPVIPTQGTLKERLQRELARREQRLAPLRALKRPCFLVHADTHWPGPAGLPIQTSSMFTELETARGADRVAVLLPQGDTLLDLARSLGETIRSAMDALDGKLPELAFDLVCLSTGGVVARTLLHLLPSALGVYAPSNVVLLGAPNRGFDAPAARATVAGASAATWLDGQQATLDALDRRRHHHDVQIFAVVGTRRGASEQGDGFVTPASGHLLERHAVSQGGLQPSGVQLFPAAGERSYLEDAATKSWVLKWIDEDPDHRRSPIRIDPETFFSP